MQHLLGRLADLQAAHQYRQRRVLEGPQQPHQIIDGRPVLAFCSNDYLGLANDVRVRAAFQAGAKRYGVGAGAAHLINGHTRAHHHLEEMLADWTGRQRALLFSTGYMANLGIAQALLGRGDVICQDRLNHASLIDAARLCGAHLQRYAHADIAALKGRLQATDKQVLVSTDAVFSMDGDLAPLPQLAGLTHPHAMLMVDDAHGFGVLGSSGAGSLEHFSLGQSEVPILMATLGKALGTAGAFVAGSEELVETLIQAARTYIYTTAMPAALAEATIESIRIIREDPEPRSRLQENIDYFLHIARQQGLAIGGRQATPIQVLILGESMHALRIAEQLWEAGLMVPAIRPPTVPQGQARLRITLSASHQRADIDRLVDTLANFIPE